MGNDLSQRPSIFVAKLQRPVDVNQVTLQMFDFDVGDIFCHDSKRLSSELWQIVSIIPPCKEIVKLSRKTNPNLRTSWSVKNNYRSPSDLELFGGIIVKLIFSFLFDKSVSLNDTKSKTISFNNLNKLRKINLVELGTKFVEFQTALQEIAR